MAGRQVTVPRALDRRGHEDRKPCAKQLTRFRIGRSAVQFVVTGKLAAGRSVHYLADMHGVIRLSAHARRMRESHRRHDGDCKYGKHGDEAREHARKIGAGHGNVNSLWCRASGRKLMPRHVTN